jgi:TPP-dependent pyruvate/acetoin dehydrogenase alpha subunit
MPPATALAAVEPLIAHDRGAVPELTLADRRELLRYLLLMRRTEEAGLSLYKQGRIPGSFYDGRGQEAIGVGAAFALDTGDVVCSPLIRDLGAHLVRGTDLPEIFKHYMGRGNTLSQGREGNVHFGDRRRGVVGMVSMLPDMMVVAVGLAMAFRMRSEQRCALTFFGDGATSRGDWHEAMNWAGVERLPVVFMFENNRFAYSTPTARQFAVNPIERAAGYGVAAVTVDGNDVEAVFEAVLDARARALSGDGPTMIEAQTMRMHGHGAHDPASYVPPELLDAWQANDPIARYSAVCETAGIATGTIEDEVGAAVRAAIEVALAAPMPDPATATDGVFCDGDPEVIGTGAAPWSGYGPRA